MSWTDTHAHLYAQEFDHDRDDAVARATAADVRRILMPNIDRTSIDAMLNTESRYAQTCEAMMGLHPCSVKKDFEKELQVVEHWLSKRTFAAIGEIGTDLYWDKTYWEEQQQAFRIQVGWAKSRRLPIVIHCRQSLPETLALLEPFADGTLTGIFHCFSGTPEQAAKIVSLGFHLGIGGVATFKNGGLDPVISGLSLDHLVLETDSPFLAPVPHRGKRNEPSYIPLVAQKVATLKNISLNELQSATTRNVDRIFKIAKEG
jgi:TatD DNase family protein